MSQQVPLEAIPNQAFSIQLEETRYNLRFRDLGEIMSVDISIDDVEILVGHRVVSAGILIPFQYLEGSGGNFIFETELGDIPFWTKFEITQTLFYLTAAELEEFRAD